MLKRTLVAIISICLILLIGASSGTVAEEKTRAIIVFKDNPTPDDIGFLEKKGGVVRYVYKVIPGTALDIPQQAIDAIREMCDNPKNPANPKICDRINYIELDREVHALVKPDGKGKPAPSQPGQVLPWGIDRVDAELSWATNTGNRIKIAVIDTGIDYDHPDLDANVKGGVTFVTGTRDYNDDNGHGTHVAGTIAAENNDIGVVGVAPNAWLYGVKVLDRTGSGWVSDVVAGVDWSVYNGMQVITMSLGTSSDIQSLHEAVDNAYSRGIVVVAAAGNENGAIGYPAKYASVIAVTAIDSGNNRAWFSNYGDEAELAAPGVSIYSTYKGGRYATLDGTSMATPHVTGTVALLLATSVGAHDTNGNGRWDPEEVRYRLRTTVVDLGRSGWDPYYGYGLVNAYNALTPPNFF